MRQLLLAIVLAMTPLSVSGPISGAGQAAADGLCFEDWSDAGPVVRTNGLIPVADVLRSVRAMRKGKAIEVRLCRSGESFHYSVAVSGRDGRISWMSVDARSGRIQPLVRE